MSCTLSYYCSTDIKHTKYASSELFPLRLREVGYEASSHSLLQNVGRSFINPSLTPVWGLQHNCCRAKWKLHRKALRRPIFFYSFSQFLLRYNDIQQSRLAMTRDHGYKILFSVMTIFPTFVIAYHAIMLKPTLCGCSPCTHYQTGWVARHRATASHQHRAGQQPPGIASKPSWQVEPRLIQIQSVNAGFSL